MKGSSMACVCDVIVEAGDDWLCVENIAEIW